MDGKIFLFLHKPTWLNWNVNGSLIGGPWLFTDSHTWLNKTSHRENTSWKTNSFSLNHSEIFQRKREHLTVIHSCMLAAIQRPRTTIAFSFDRVYPELRNANKKLSKKEKRTICWCSRNQKQNVTEKKPILQELFIPGSSLPGYHLKSEVKYGEINDTNC